MSKQKYIFSFIPERELVVIDTDGNLGVATSSGHWLYTNKGKQWISKMETLEWFGVDCCIKIEFNELTNFAGYSPLEVLSVL